MRWEVGLDARSLTMPTLQISDRPTGPGRVRQLPSFSAQASLERKLIRAFSATSMHDEARARRISLEAAANRDRMALVVGEETANAMAAAAASGPPSPGSPPGSPGSPGGAGAFFPSAVAGDDSATLGTTGGTSAIGSPSARRSKRRDKSETSPAAIAARLAALCACPLFAGMRPKEALELATLARMEVQSPPPSPSPFTVTVAARIVRGLTTTDD